MGWIYAFRDARYDTGIKVGWDNSDKGNRYIDIAQSYSPARIIYETAWQIHDETSGRSGSNQIEKQAWQGLPRLLYQNNGQEWFDVDIGTCIKLVSQNLGLVACKRPLDKVSNFDDFRSPKVISSSRRSQYKQVLWIYEEHLTKRIKIQRIDDWQTPREQRRRYSRNGFYPVAAFTYHGNVSLADNIAIHDVWKRILQNFDTPPDNSTYGWLPVDITANDVRHFLEKTDLEALAPPFNQKPDGIRTSYNKPERRNLGSPIKKGD